MIDPALVAEANRRFVRTAEARADIDEDLKKIDGELFDKQTAFVQDSSRFKAARCTRRAGKSEVIYRYAAREARKTGGLVRIWCITRVRVKELHWVPLKRLLERIGIQFTANETELKVFIAGGGEIRLVGADKEKETEKKRGDKTVLDIVDEAQLFGSFLKTLCDDVIGPSLIDMRGTLCLMGTPGIVCAGYWFEATQNDPAKRQHGFSVHFWSILDNPHLPHAKDELADLKKRRGWADDHPTWLREYCGLWVNDSGALVYRYDPKKNGYTQLPKGVVLTRFVAGGDLGSGGTNDPMALVVWGWAENDSRLWEVFSKKYVEDTTTSAMMKDFLELRDDCGGFIAQVLDTGGGGKLTANDIKERWGVDFEAAQKTEKHKFQRLMNDDITSGLIQVKEDGELAREWSVLPKHPDDETKEDPRFDNHCSDAGLYSHRKARHFWATPDGTPPPAPGSTEALEQEEERIADELVDHDEQVSAQDEDWTTW